MANNKPVHEVRLGVVKAAIWANDTKVGVRYGVTFQRLYKDGEEWKTTDSFVGGLQRLTFPPGPAFPEGMPRPLSHGTSRPGRRTRWGRGRYTSDRRIPT